MGSGFFSTTARGDRSLAFGCARARLPPAFPSDADAGEEAEVVEEAEVGEEAEAGAAAVTDEADEAPDADLEALGASALSAFERAAIWAITAGSGGATA